mmetsp:Transcript_17640/g.24887  ORF Transcript_17640/g.24887 Transcript_17640/m.24887 type:complete len:120 (+) Transcript_17640:389-748(+)|eukprot:CAMPEP_0184856510 /NCGR_PEP_ID=MMETSP0580-20130426/1700_1 /TAXON_ID=1118495 /ORGANISM="Dactyliosolen fragilissimus" /LENGTH=119 /DNA_ID=CAMNT_0027351587 /DNA_START=271 /DNA_END=630 /DNA_ORIENTATION=+
MSDKLKPGQKYATPTPGFGDRVFYETLLRQRPDSAIAQEWCVNYGVLPAKEAENLYKIILRRKKNSGSSSASITVKKNSNGTKKRKSSKGGSKNIVDEVAYDAGMSAGASEGIGTLSGV